MGKHFWIVQVRKDGKWVSMSRIADRQGAILLAESYTDADWSARVIAAPQRHKAV